MLIQPLCSACGALDWEKVGVKRYAKADSERLSPYLARKYRLMFSTWFPEQTTAEISVELCRQCGFVGFSPRPTEAEVTAKYELSVTMGTHDRKKPAGNADDMRRSNALCEELSPYLARGPRRVLDYGGGDGRLMTRLIEAGHTCFVIDFIPEPVPGVTRLGATLAELEAQTMFDVVVLSHVLEHVADPLKLLASLRTVTKEGGVLWLEVPMELFRQVPPKSEPLTHINFFQPESLRIVMERAGFEVQTCEVRWHYTKRELVVRAVGVRGTPREVTPSAAGPSFSRAAMRGDVRQLVAMVAAEPRRSAEVGTAWLRRKARAVMRRV